MRPNEYRAYSVHCRFTPHRQPYIRFLFVESDFCLQLPSHNTSRYRSCSWLTVPLITARKGLSPYKLCAAPGAQNRGQLPPDPASMRRRILLHSNYPPICVGYGFLPPDIDSRCYNRFLATGTTISRNRRRRLVSGHLVFGLQVHCEDFLPQPEQTLFLIGLPHLPQGEHPHDWHIFGSFRFVSHLR